MKLSMCCAREVRRNPDAPGFICKACEDECRAIDVPDDEDDIPNFPAKLPWLAGKGRPSLEKVSLNIMLKRSTVEADFAKFQDEYSERFDRHIRDYFTRIGHDPTVFDRKEFRYYIDDEWWCLWTETDA